MQLLLLRTAGLQSLNCSPSGSHTQKTLLKKNKIKKKTTKRQTEKTRHSRNVAQVHLSLQLLLGMAVHPVPLAVPLCSL